MYTFTAVRNLYVHILCSISIFIEFKPKGDFMPKGTINDMYVKTKQYGIYALLDRETREFIVIKTYNDPKKYYSRNMNGNVTMTCKMIASMQKFGRRP